MKTADFSMVMDGYNPCEANESAVYFFKMEKDKKFDIKWRKIV